MLIYDIKPPELTPIAISDDNWVEIKEPQRIIDLRYDLYYDGEIFKCKYSDNTIHPKNIESVIENLINK